MRELISAALRHMAVLALVVALELLFCAYCVIGDSI